MGSETLDRQIEEQKRDWIVAFGFAKQLSKALGGTVVEFGQRVRFLQGGTLVVGSRVTSVEYAPGGAHIIAYPAEVEIVDDIGVC